MEKYKMEAGSNEIKPSNKLYPYKDTFPKLDSSVFVADGARIIGDVKIDESSSVWYNTVIRGDVNYVKIGKMTNIQDNCMLHVTNGKYPLNIGDKVTIGHNVTLHGCTLEDECLIGMGAVVLDGAHIEKNSIVAAGAVVKQGFKVPSGKMVAGVPAKVIRDLSEDEIAEFANSAEHYYEYTKITIDSLKKYNYKI